MTFAENLRQKMDERDISVRKLAATWRPSNPESARRSLNKYLLEGQIPSDRIVAEIAEALEIAVDDLADVDGGDDEEDQMALLRDLMTRVEALIAQQASEPHRKRSRRKAAA